LESQTSLVELIQVSRPQLTINEHLGVLPSGTSCRANYVLRSVKSLGFHSKTPSYKTPTNLTVDGCSAQAQAF